MQAIDRMPKKQLTGFLFFDKLKGLIKCGLRAEIF
jgi:hypothetical protein